MQYSTRYQNNVAIIDLKGSIEIGFGDAQLREAVNSELANGHTHILLNMQGVTTVDSNGMGAMVDAYTTITNRGGKLKLVNLPTKLADLLYVTQLIAVFDVYEDEWQAVQSFG